jgi:hypothetical protein
MVHGANRGGLDAAKRKFRFGSGIAEGKHHRFLNALDQDIEIVIRRAKKKSNHAPRIRVLVVVRPSVRFRPLPEALVFAPASWTSPLLITPHY